MSEHRLFRGAPDAPAAPSQERLATWKNRIAKAVCRLRTADDVSWRRSKLGLHVGAAGRQQLEAWFEGMARSMAGVAK